MNKQFMLENKNGEKMYVWVEVHKKTGEFLLNKPTFGNLIKNGFIEQIGIAYDEIGYIHYAFEAKNVFDVEQATYKDYIIFNSYAEINELKGEKDVI